GPDAGSTSSTTAAASTSAGTPGSSSDGGVSTTDDPPQPGDAVWQRLYDGGGDEVFYSVVMLGDDFVVCGYSDAARTGADVLLARYLADGGEDWRVIYDFEQDTDSCNELLFSAGGSLYATGQHGRTDGEVGGWVGCFRTVDGSQCWFTETIGFSGRSLAYSIDNMIVVAGSESALSGGFASAYYNWGQLAWEHTLEGGMLYASTAIGSEMFVGGELGDRIYLAGYGEAGLAELAITEGPAAGPDAIQRLASDGESIFAVGYVASQSSRDPWIGRYTLEGELVWQHADGELALDEEFESLAIADDGTIFVVGFVTSADNDSAVASWTADGELRWSRTYPELVDGDDIARDVAITADGELLVVGQAQPAGGTRDAYVMRVLP
ncbi:MAG: hypothetical protein IAG13_09140, partial [Deltaproteobacteria bacterium]|nr:hypothetical protein [Nannocystaceae bacterium]